MFSNFNKVFNNPLPQPQQKIPASYAEYISKSLPKGIRYIPVAQGGCQIVSDTDTFTISGMQFSLTNEQEKMLGNNYSLDDVLNYIENSQQSIKLIPPESGIVKINGNEVKFSKIITFPFLNIDLLQSYYIMQAPKFPNPSPLTLGGETYEYALNLRRVANNSVNIQMFESEQAETPLAIRLSNNIKTNEIQFTMNCYPQKAKTVKDLAKCISIYNDVIDGKGKINGNALPNKKMNAKKFDESLVNFWVKVMKIADELGLEFVPTSDNISKSTLLKVECVYQNLINHIPVRGLKIVDSLDEKDNAEDPTVLSELVGKCIGLLYETVEPFDFFGNRFELHELIGICDAVIDSIIPKDGGGNKVILRDKSENEQKYVSILGFKNKEELDEYRKENFDDIMNILSSAKYIEDLV